MTENLYLDLMKRCVSNWIYADAECLYSSASRRLSRKQHLLAALLGRPKGRKPPQIDPRAAKIAGTEWPSFAHTMIGMKRLENLQNCVETVIKDKVPGDLIETGVWRGGATILMRAILRAHDEKNRKVWVADSFTGLPPPDLERYPHDTPESGVGLLHQCPELMVSLEEVRNNFESYGLLDDQVCFLKGWFKDTLPNAPIEKIAVMRLDGDMYESTMDALRELYPKLSPGGFVIIDDYGTYEACRAAVSDYRQQHKIEEPIEFADDHGAFWRRTEPANVHCNQMG